MKSVGTHRVAKIVHVVKNLESVLDNMVKVFGIDRPEIIKGTAESRGKTDGKFFTAYKGRDINASVLLSNVDMGSVIMEVIQPLDEESPWGEFLKEKGEGIFSAVYNVDNFHELMESMENEGMPNILQGEYEGGRYGYWDTTSQIGFPLGLQESDDNK